MYRVSLLLPLPIERLYDYAIPDNQHDVLLGSVLLVPFGKRKLLGVVWGTHGQEKKIADAINKNHQPIHQPIDNNNIIPLAEPDHNKTNWDKTEPIPLQQLKQPMKFFADEPFFYPPLTPQFRQFLTKLADYYLTPLGSVLKMALPEVAAFTIKKTKSEKVKNHTDKKLINNRTTAEKKIFLNSAQEKIAKELSSQLTNKFSVSLLKGVTGSGKTAVYLDLIKTAAQQGKKTLVLLPEISLKTQWLEKFHDFFAKENFIPKVIEWHSHKTKKQRTEDFKNILKGQVDVLVGARSALLLPINDLGLIIVDEEHDASYKQNNGVRYHARDMAVQRAALEQIPVLLVSATPSLETIQNVRIGKYQEWELLKRARSDTLPQIQLVDLKQTPLANNEWISQPLALAIEKTLSQKKQILLFLNRRGFAPLTLCRHCGTRLVCKQCDSYLVYHQKKNRYQCHLCDWFLVFSKTCPNCSTADALIPFGPGVERVMAELAKKFPTAKLLLASSDTIKKEADLNQLMLDMIDKKIDIIIGTQMMGKGHDFPELQLVGILAADSLLYTPDPRALERAWQILEQVIGRAGRGDMTPHAKAAATNGLALLQTYNPHEPMFQLLVKGEKQQFIEKLLATRANAQLPPFGRLALVTLSGKNENQLQTLTRTMKLIGQHVLKNWQSKKLPNDNSVSNETITRMQLFGPAPAPIHVIRGQFRIRFMIQGSINQQNYPNLTTATSASTQMRIPIQEFLSHWLQTCRQEIPLLKRLKLEIDIDPHDFM